MRALILILALLAFAPRAACAEAIETMPVTRIDGVPHLSANEIARVLDAAKFWRADVRKLVLPPGGTVGTPRITVSGEATRITFPTDGVADATVANRSHKHFRVRLEGFFTGTLPDQLPADGAIHKLRAIPSATGSAFEIELT